jgi:hypothetical protein
MNLNLSIESVQWKPVISIPQGTILEKGAKNEWYPRITKAAGQVTSRYGCYAWGTDSEIFYCGSFAGDYNSRRKLFSNLQGRVHNYLQNHRVKPTGQVNTNLMVFQNLNRILQTSAMTLFHFNFEQLWINGQCIDFETYSNDPDLVHTVEELLICTYRQQNQCGWNRT